MEDKTYEKRFSEHNIFWYIYTALIILIHLFLYLQIKKTLGPSITTYLWIPFSLFMTLLSYITRRTKQIRSKRNRKWTDRASVLWLSFVCISAILFLLLNIEELIIMQEIRYGAKELYFIFSLSLAITAYGVHRANKIETINITIFTEKLHTNKLRIVQLTDMHIGQWTGAVLLDTVVKKINEAKPDIVVITGDLVDGRGKGRDEDAKKLREINAPCGIYAITGNHDYYDDVEDSIEFMEKAKMKVLRTEVIDTCGILIAGADDRDHLTAKTWGLTKSELLVLSKSKEQKNKFLLLLRHRPIVETGTKGHFDLQLSGHTHGGQLFPLWSSRHKIGGHSYGLKELKDGGYIYVSNGAGFVGPPLRFFAPPEITVFDLVNTKQQTGFLQKNK
ncbi:MAG: metallophosphoesterase [Synergistaceae bacterium]